MAAKREADGDHAAVEAVALGLQYAEQKSMLIRADSDHCERVSVQTRIDVWQEVYASLATILRTAEVGP